MISLSHAPNFRDVGALPLVGGGMLRPGLLYRSEAVLEPTPEDAADIRACGIRIVFDLRSRPEAVRAPNAFWEQEGIEHHNLDLLSGFPRDHNPWAVLREDPSRAGGAAMMHALYAGMPRAALGYLPRLFDATAQGRVPLLVHCTAGKDRTGFIMAMLLAALGVEPDAIVDDYMASADRKTIVAREATRHMARSYVGQEIGDDAIEEIMGVKRSYLSASFAAIDAEFGGVDPYLAQVGLGMAKRAALRNHLIA